MNVNSKDRKSDKISLVIATLGGDTLNETIDLFNSGTLKPDEIIISIPEEFASRVASLVEHKNVKLVKSIKKGQVAQRIAGFKAAQYELVLQSDDDMLPANDCLEELYRAMQNLDALSAVGARLVDIDSGQSAYKSYRKQGCLNGIYHYLMNGKEGFRQGVIDKSGSSIGVDTFASDCELIEVEWLAGGLVLHRKDNLVLENYWPLKGKAYYEDVVHSCLLKEKGVRLYISARAKCSLELFASASLPVSDFLKDKFRDFEGRRYFMNRFHRMNYRMYLFYLISISSFLAKKIFKPLMKES